MENTIVSGNRRTFRAALFGVAMIVLGGTALAADAPTVAPLKFEYKAKDANGNTVTLENKITADYEANKVAVDSNGNVYVVDAVSNTVSVFNTNGRLVKEIGINRPLAIGIDNLKGLVYISGALNGVRSVFVLDNNDDEKDDNGNLNSIGWSNPSNIAIATGNTIGSDGNNIGSIGDIYVADDSIIKRVDSQGNVKVYGPYGGERYASETWIYGVNVRTYQRTRHKVASFQGVAVDEARGLIYVSANEIIEYLVAAPQALSVSCKGDSITGCTSGSDTSYTIDAESWLHYNGNMPSTTNGTTNSTLQAIVTDSSYIYWNPIDPLSVPPSFKYHVFVIDMATGELLRRINSGLGEGAYGFQPRGLTLDGKGRLYVAGVDIGTATSIGGIKVYDVATSPEATMAVGGSGFVSGNYTDVTYNPGLGDFTKGRLFATLADNRTVSSYGIDGGTNPANTAPGKPILLEPVNSAAVNTPTPTLKIKNATDPQNDPLTYGYEIKDSDGNIVTSAAGIISGSNNETLMTVAQGLADSSYHWHVQSFDGELATWSDEGAFCVDYVNTNPTDPAAIAPVNNAPVSPFASSVYNSLSWTASRDEDCSNDIVTYEVTISDVQGNLLKSFSGVASTSINVSDISGLVRGDTYKWTVRAVDSRGGKSGYSEGSFVYKTSVVRFESSQPGTKVYIDGNYAYLGRSLGTASVEVQDITPGLHFVAFVKAGYEPLYKLADVVDPLVNDSAVTVSAKDVEWVTASRIRPSGTGVEIVRLNGGDAVPFVVDYNNDGLKDMIAGDKEGKVSLYLAQVDETKKVVLIDSGAIQADGSDINAGSKAVPFMADYDNDGNQDLLIGSGDGTVYLYKGSASGFVAAGTLALKDSNENNLVAFNLAPALVDYNSDGKKDLVVGSSDGIIRLYINTGSDESPAFGAPAAIKADGGDLNVGSNSRPFFTDWNSDGKKDLVVGDGFGKVSLFFNVGTDDAPDFKSVSSLQQWIKEKKRERGNREFIPYLGYNHDLDDLTGGTGEASPFVVDWSGTSARDVIVGNGSGGVVNYITE